MHGPDAAVIMRQELKYIGPIIGLLMLSISLIYLLHYVLSYARSDRECPARRHCQVYRLRGEYRVDKATHQSQADVRTSNYHNLTSLVDK